MLSIFRKKTRIPIDLSGLRCDMHSHLVPGVDDGAPDLFTSIELIRGLYDIGYRKVITTPHIMWEMYKNTHDNIVAGAQQVRSRLLEEEIPVEFSAAAEYFMDEHFDLLLKSDEPLLTIKDNMVLVEFSFIRQPIELKEILFRMQIKGYQPVIAHPERYHYFATHKNWFDEIREIGCLFQLNILSLGGFYGKQASELASYLIRKKYIDFIGTDLHNARHLQVMHNAENPIMEGVLKLLDSGILQNATL